MFKPKYLLIVILILGALLRFIWLDRVPHSLNGDELHYVLSAKAFVLTGKDVTQAVTPLDLLVFHYPPRDIVQAELPYFLDMLTVGFFPFSMFTSALPSAFLSFLLIIIMYFIGKKLFNEQIALITAFLTAINPWFIGAGRTSYEMVSATFFYMCALYIMLIAKGWRILWAFPIFVLAFYTYIATKLIFLPIILVFSLYCYFVVHKKQYLKQYLTLISLGIIFVGFFLFQLHSSPGQSRTAEILTPAYPAVAEQVNNLRRQTIQFPLQTIFENKITVFSGMLLHSTLEVFSSGYLFLNGDYFFLLGNHGLMYLIDPLFILLGVAVLYTGKRKLFWFLLGMIGISILPQIVHKSSLVGNFSPHTTLLPPFLILLIAAGIWEAIVSVKKNQRIIGIIIIGVYFVLLGNFLNIYFFQMPLQHNFYVLPDRLLANYVSLTKTTGEQINIYTPDPRGKFEEYLFYTNSYTPKTVPLVTNALRDRKYVIGNVSFISCDRQVTQFDKKITSIIHAECGMLFTADSKSIPDLADSGAVYRIVHDRFCSKYNLKPYVSGLSINDFALDKISNKKFCETFITSI